MEDQKIQAKKETYSKLYNRIQNIGHKCNILIEKEC